MGLAATLAMMEFDTLYRLVTLETVSIRIPS